MLDFKTPEELKAEILNTSATLSGDAAERFDIMQALSDENIEVYAAQISGCIIFLVDSCEEPAFFTYPEGIFEGADEAAALLAISEYATLSEIPQIITDVSLCELPAVLKGVRHADVDAAGEDSFTVSIKTECMLARVLPELLYDDLYIGELTENFAEDYKRLLFDPLVNKYEGYDCRSALADEDADFFVREAQSEFNSGIAMTFAASLFTDEGENKFIGEGVIFRFNGRAEAELSVRIIPSMWGKGYGEKLLRGLCKIGEELGLCSLVGRVNRENLPSVSLCSKVFEQSRQDGMDIIFRIEL